MSSDRRHTERDTIVFNPASPSNDLAASLCVPQVPDMYAAFWQHVETRPRSCAVVSGGEQVTYRELADLVSDAQRRIERLTDSDGQPSEPALGPSPASIAQVLAWLGTSQRFVVPPVEVGANDALDSRLASPMASISVSDELAETVPAPPPTKVEPGNHGLLGRMIVNDRSNSGVFSPAPTLVPGAEVRHGQVVGTLGPDELRSRFNGRITLVYALLGERLTPHQSIAWLAPWGDI